MLLLKGKEKAEIQKQHHKELVKKYFGDKRKFVAVLFFGESNPSQVYVRLKAKYSKEIGLDFLVFGQKVFEITEGYPDLLSYQRKNYTSKDEVIDLIRILNNDERCIGIICQLPLTPELKPFQQDICNEISPIKDMDGLGKDLQNRAFEGKIDFLPATAQAVISLWNAYNLGSFEGKDIAVIGQSKIVGLPISKYLKLHGANVYTFDLSNTLEEIQIQCKVSDIIISCTGDLHMVNENFINNNGNQILIDVGYGFLYGKSTGDIDFEKIENKVYAISPVPGGVGPMTVSCLFGNIFVILKQKDKIQTL